MKTILMKQGFHIVHESQNVGIFYFRDLLHSKYLNTEYLFKISI